MSRRFGGAFGILLAFFTVFALQGCNGGSGSQAAGSVSDFPISGISSTGPIPVMDSEEQSFLALINQYRAQNNAPALQISIALMQSATWMSNDMATGNYMDHTDSLGRDPFQRMAEFGYTYNTVMGENIAAGNSDAQSTFDQWTSDAAHNDNMIDAGYKVIGVGRAYNANSTYGWYWTTDFGGYVDATLQ